MKFASRRKGLSKGLGGVSLQDARRKGATSGGDVPCRGLQGMLLPDANVIKGGREGRCPVRPGQEAQKNSGKNCFSEAAFF